MNWSARRSRIAVVCFLLACFIAGLGAGPRTFLVSGALERVLLESLSGENALRNISQLTQWDRTTSSEGYVQAVRFAESEMRKAGLQVQMDAYEKDQSHMAFQLRPSPYWPPVGWNVRSAELWVIAPEREKIADYSVQPVQLARYSRAGDAQSELVDVGTGLREEDYRGLDVKGKIVLATGAPQSVQSLAVRKFGAAGTITWGLSESYSPGKDDDYPDMVGWQVLNPIKVAGFEPTFAFAISRAAGQKLQRRLRQGPVTVHARVDAQFSEMPLLTPTAVVRGTDKADEEFLFTAHIDHVRPSANDNASGSGLLMEIARVLNQAVQSGRIPALRRSVRFLWVSEGPGTTGYVTHHAEARNKILSAINLDMVGENAAVTHSILRISRTPDSLPSFLPDLLEHMLRWVDSMKVHEPTGSRGFLNFRIQPFSPSSDHYVLNDGVLKIPAMMMNFAPDDFHHANMDTLDKCDPTELKRVGLAAAATACFVAAAGAPEAELLAREVADKGRARLWEAQRVGEKMLFNARPEDRDETCLLVTRWLHHTALREQGAVSSVLRLDSSAAVTQAVASLRNSIRRAEDEHQQEFLQYWSSLTGGRKPPVAALDDNAVKAAAVIPRLRTEFFHQQWDRYLDPEKMTSAESDWLAAYKQKLYQSYMRIPEFLNFVDGQRSLLDIRDAVSVERFHFSEGLDEIGTWEGLDLEHSRIDAGDLLKLMRILERQGWLELRDLAK